MESLEPHHWSDDLFDKAVILFHQIIEVFYLANVDHQAKQTCQHQQNIDVFKPGQVGAAFVHDHFFRQAIAINGLPEEGRGRRFVAAFGQHKVDDVAELVNRTVQVQQFSL